MSLPLLSINPFFFIDMQAFIHPGLAHFFWSIRQISGVSAVFSPYQTCNGTLTSNLNHEMTYQDHGRHLYFYDMAGCGLVHMCGEKNFADVVLLCTIDRLY